MSYKEVQNWSKQFSQILEDSKEYKLFLELDEVFEGMIVKIKEYIEKNNKENDAVYLGILIRTLKAYRLYVDVIMKGFPNEGSILARRGIENLGLLLHGKKHPELISFWLKHSYKESKKELNDTLKKHSETYWKTPFFSILKKVHSEYSIWGGHANKEGLEDNIKIQSEKIGSQTQYGIRLKLVSCSDEERAKEKISRFCSVVVQTLVIIYSEIFPCLFIEFHDLIDKKVKQVNKMKNR